MTLYDSSSILAHTATPLDTLQVDFLMTHYRRLPNLRNFLTLDIDQNIPKFLKLGDVNNNNIMVFDLIEECPYVRTLRVYVGR